MQIGIVDLGEKLLSLMRLGFVDHIEGKPIDPERKPAKSRTKSRTAAQLAE